MLSACLVRFNLVRVPRLLDNSTEVREYIRVALLRCLVLELVVCRADAADWGLQHAL